MCERTARTIPESWSHSSRANSVCLQQGVHILGMNKSHLNRPGVVWARLNVVAARTRAAIYVGYRFAIAKCGAKGAHIVRIVSRVRALSAAGIRPVADEAMRT